MHGLIGLLPIGLFAVVFVAVCGGFWSLPRARPRPGDNARELLRMYLRVAGYATIVMAILAVALLWWVSGAGALAWTAVVGGVMLLASCGFGLISQLALNRSAGGWHLRGVRQLAAVIALDFLVAVVLRIADVFVAGSTDLMSAPVLLALLGAAAAGRLEQLQDLPASPHPRPSGA
jgi:hypothetical protein